MLIRTIGVTTQATKTPGTPRAINRDINTSAPNKTKPVLIKNSVNTAARIQGGVPTVLEMIRPTIKAQSAYSRLYAFTTLCAANM